MFPSVSRPHSTTAVWKHVCTSLPLWTMGLMLWSSISPTISTGLCVEHDFTGPRHFGFTGPRNFQPESWHGNSHVSQRFEAPCSSYEVPGIEFVTQYVPRGVGSWPSVASIWQTPLSRCSAQIDAFFCTYRHSLSLQEC